MSRILLIEDDATVRESLTETLKSEGYDVVPREDGSELKQLLKSKTFEVVITDLKLPGKSGIDLIREMRKSPSDYEIIIITGYGTMQSAIDALQLGVYDYINKPFEPALMLNTVHRAVEKVELSRQKIEAEKTVRFLKDFNEEILESSLEAIIVLDRNIICQYWNTAAEKLSSIKRKDILGKDLVREKTWILGQGFPKQFQEVLNGNVAEKHVEVMSPDRQLLTLRQKLSPLRDPDGKVKGILVFLTDVTHLKTAESKTDDIKRRRDSSQRKDICLCNISRDAAIAGNSAEFFELSLRHISDFLDGKNNVKAEIQFDSKAYSYGRAKSGSAGFEAQFDAGIFGKGILTVYCSDTLASGDKDLVTIVANHIGNEIIKRYEAKNAQHQRCMEGIGRLAGGLAHNLNNILSGILGYATFIKSEIAKDNPIQVHLSTIEESANLAAQMTSQLLDMSSGIVKGGNIIDINDNVKRVIALMRVFFDRNILINSRLSQDVCQIKGDSSKIDSVLVNICLNARDAMHAGGRLSIQTGNFDLQKPSEAPELKPGRYAQISFTDTGIGMDENSVMYCFDPFFSTKGLGYGLGLSSAFGIIKAHGGNISIQSAQGIGTKVSIYLPSAGKGILTKKPEMPLEAGQTILVIEAEELVRKAASDILSKLGYKVLSASTEEEAFSILKKRGKEIKAVFLDVVLPDAGYLKIYEEIKKTSKSIKLILSSAYKLPAEARRAAEGEGALFLQKPYNFSELSSIIHQSLGRVAAKKRLK